MKYRDSDRATASSGNIFPGRALIPVIKRVLDQLYRIQTLSILAIRRVVIVDVPTPMSECHPRTPPYCLAGT